MLISRLGFCASQLGKLNRPASVLLCRNFAKRDIDLDDDGIPINYSSTDAAKWKAEYHRVPPTERVWYTPYIVTASVLAFMIYFCILREENDIDEYIYQPLPKTIKGIEDTYPGYDFTQKPDYVVYHEQKREMKRKAKEEAEKASKSA